MVGVLFFVSAFIAEVIGTVAGFGSSTVFLPLALFFVDFKTALVLVAVFHVAGNLGRITFFRRGFDKRLALLFGLPSVLLTLAGALLVSYTSQELLKLALGVFLLLFSVKSLFWKDTKIGASSKNAVIGGGLSGFLAGLIGTGGAIRSAFLASFGLAKEKYVATAAIVALAVDLTRLPIYIASGFLENKYYYTIPLLLAIALAGSYTGKKILNKIPRSQFKKIVLTAIALAGAKFSLDGMAALQ